MKGIGLLRKLQAISPRTSLLTIYKSFIRPDLDYSDVVYDQSSNDAFSNKLETVQYNAALAITGAIKDISREKLYQELGLEYLQQRRSMRRLCLFYKIVSTKLPAYIFDCIPPVRQSQGHPNTFNSFSCRAEYFEKSYFLCVIGESNKLNPETRRSGSYNIFRKSILTFIRPSASKVYNINDTSIIKLITRLLLGFSHLREHKFKHNFQGTLNSLCSCSIEVESSSHYFLCCHFFDALRATLMNDLKNIDRDLPTLRDEYLTNILLYDNQIYDDKTNQITLMHIIRYIKDSQRFDEPLFNPS